MYQVGDRWIWRDNENPNQFHNSLSANFPGSFQNRNKTVRGYISEIKPGMSIIIKWENGRMIQYNDYMIEEEPRLSPDKEYYRNQKLESLGI
jgi:hypothetical protein